VSEDADASVDTPTHIQMCVPTYKCRSRCGLVLTQVSVCCAAGLHCPLCPASISKETRARTHTHAHTHTHTHMYEHTGVYVRRQHARQRWCAYVGPGAFALLFFPSSRFVPFFLVFGSCLHLLLFWSSPGVFVIFWCLCHLLVSFPFSAIATVSFPFSAIAT